MRPLFKTRQEELDDLLPDIRSSIQDWQIITVALTENCILPYDEMMAKLVDMYNGYQGFIYHLGYFRVVAFVKAGRIRNYATARKALQVRLPQDDCMVNMWAASEQLLEGLRADFLQPDESYADDFQVCHLRDRPVVMVADDDKMIARMMAKIIGDRADIVCVENGKEVIGMYNEHIPDLIFLDIHMPGANGLTNLERLMALNPFASVVILSADSVEAKVLGALERGAQSFVGKPLQRDRVLALLKLCPTIAG